MHQFLLGQCVLVPAQFCPVVQLAQLRASGSLRRGDCHNRFLPDRSRQRETGGGRMSGESARRAAPSHAARQGHRRPIASSPFPLRTPALLLIEVLGPEACALIRHYRTNQIRSNPLKTITVATRHSTLTPALASTATSTASLGRSAVAQGPKRPISPSPKSVRSRARRAGGALRG